MCVNIYLLFKNMRLKTLPSSTDIILTSAKECFFQHGYAAANISMIGRYAEISRVTIHKQFKSKEDIFRSVVEKHIHDNYGFLERYVQSEGDFWAETESFILNRCGGMFEEISSSIVRTDLLHAGQSYCLDIIHKNIIRVRESISFRIEKELSEKRITLKNIDISVEEFSRLIESAPLGLVVESQEKDNIGYVKHLMKVFKASSAL